MMSGNSQAGTAWRLPRFVVEKVIGASHLRSGKPCQDEVGAWALDGIVAIALADGHGTCKHADVGARLAVDVALLTLVQFVEKLGAHASNLRAVQDYASHPLRRNLVQAWAEGVRAQAGSEGAHLEDYGSTLLFALATPDFLLLGQLGDGDLLLVHADGRVDVPLPADPVNFADETPSLCQKEAWHGMRVQALPPPRGEQLLLLSTDGYSKSYATDASFRQIGPDYLELIRTERNLDGLKPHLRGFLEQVTTGGSGDDIALAMLYWPPTAQPGEEVAEVAEQTMLNSSFTLVFPDPIAERPAEGSETPEDASISPLDETSPKGKADANAADN